MKRSSMRSSGVTSGLLPPVSCACFKPGVPTVGCRSRRPLGRFTVDREALCALSPADLIDRFLKEGGHRIVAEEGEVVEEVRTEAELSGDDDLVTEDLAEIYLAQGLYDEAIAIYRKLSLLNPEKSVYFASLIDKIANK
jgi:tetratricopeptide (TPR) repeat protein